MKLRLFSPPLFTAMKRFQFAQSALPSPLAALLPCDSSRPMAAQAHLVPCEAERRSTTLPQQPAAVATHAATTCVCVVPAGLENH